MTPEQEVEFGNRAHEVLDNPAFIKANEDIKKEVMEQWLNTPARDAEAREKLWMMLKQQEKLLLTLKSMLDSGKLAKAALQHQRTITERAKELLYRS